MEQSGFTGYCQGCDYSLAGVPGTVCPECGRGFDPANPRTFNICAKRRRRRRRMVRGAIVLGLLLALFIFRPRGYASGTITFTCPCGQTYTSTRMQLIGPEWFSIAYPHWSNAPSIPAAAAGHTHGWSFSIAASRRMFTLGGTRGAGGLSASGGGRTNMVNGALAIPENALEALEAVVGPMARTRAYGVRMGRADVPPPSNSEPPSAGS